MSAALHGHPERAGSGRWATDHHHLLSSAVKPLGLSADAYRTVTEWVARWECSTVDAILELVQHTQAVPSMSEPTRSGRLSDLASRLPGTPARWVLVEVLHSTGEHHVTTWTTRADAIGYSGALDNETESTVVELLDLETGAVVVPAVSLGKGDVIETGGTVTRVLGVGPRGVVVEIDYSYVRRLSPSYPLTIYRNR